MVLKVFYNYDQIANLVNKTASDIILNYVPDIILAIGGGGLIPARMLRNKVNKPIKVVSVRLYNSDDTIGNNIEIIQWIDESFKDKKVLIVDEINDTGTTLNFCIDKLKNENNLTDFSVFVIHDKMKEKTKEIQDFQHYFVGKYIEDNWVVYPWDD